MQNLDKWKIIMVVAAVGLIGFLFLPMVTVSGFGVNESVSFFNALTGGGKIELSFTFILVLAGSVATIVGAFKKDKKSALIGSAAGAIGSLIELATAGSQFKELEQMGVDCSVGIALWVVLICCAVNAFLSWKAEQ